MFAPPPHSAAGASSNGLAVTAQTNSVVSRYAERPRDFNIPSNANPTRKTLVRGDAQGVLDDGLKIIMDYSLDPIAVQERRRRVSTKRVNVIGDTVDTPEANYGMLRIRKGSPMWTVAYDGMTNTQVDTLSDQHPYCFTVFNGIEIDARMVATTNNFAFRRLFRFLGLSSEEKDITTAGSTIGVMVSGRMQTYNNGLTNIYAGDKVRLVVPDVRADVRVANRNAEPKLIKDYPAGRFEAVFERFDPRQIVAWPQFALTEYLRPNANAAHKKSNLLAATTPLTTLNADEHFALAMATFIKTVAVAAIASFAERGYLAVNEAALRAAMATPLQVPSLDALQRNSNGALPINVAASTKLVAGALGLYTGDTPSSAASPSVYREVPALSDTVVGRSTASALVDKTLQQTYSFDQVVPRSAASAAALADPFVRKATTAQTYTSDLARVQKDGICQALIAFEQAHQDIASQIVGVSRTSSQGGVMAPLILTS